MIPQEELRAAFTAAIEAGGNKVKSIDVVPIKDDMGPCALRADFDLTDGAGSQWHTVLEFVHTRPRSAPWRAWREWPETLEAWQSLLDNIARQPIARPRR
jgi:hypothetical protein